MAEIRRNTVRALQVAVCAVLSVVAVQDVAPARAQVPGENPPLAALEIDIWPEFDQESSALIILRAEVATDATLPAPVSVRIPATSRGPTAVAEAATADSQLMNVAYGTPDVQIDFITVTFQITERFFHVEFYEPISTVGPERVYEYMWPGDFSVAGVTVQLQEPAASSNVSVTPDLGVPAVRDDRLNYREAALGALEAGKPLSVDIKYQKTDPRTTAEIMGFAPAPTASSQDDGSGLESSSVLVPAAVVAAAIVAAALAFMVSRRPVAGPAVPASRVQRRRAAPKEPACAKCSTTLRPGDRFCASCGHPLKGKASG